MNRWIIFILLLSLGTASSAQSLAGYVVDSLGEPVSFASVSAGGKVVFSDLDGKFSFPAAKLTDTIYIRAMGYRPLAQKLASNGDTLRLMADGVQLEDVVINPGVNPAMRMIRGAIENRRQNRPEALEAFSYTGYNKLKFINGGEFVVERNSEKTNLGFRELFIMETVVETRFQRPDRYRTEVKASKVSAYPGQALPLSAADLQSVSFYEEQMAVLGSRFVSPISPAGPSKYVYILEDTVLRGPDSLFLIRFVPKKGEFNALEGSISLQSGTWAVTHVDASLALREPDILLEGGTIRQLYQELPNGHWFPLQLDADLKSKPFSKSDTTGFTISSRSYLEDVSLAAEAIGLNKETVVVAPDAGKQPDLLHTGRTVPLSSSEQRAYHFLDSLGEEANLPQLMEQMQHLALGRIKMGPLDMELDRLFGGNMLEGTRIGLGLRTNEEISERWSLGAWGGFGLKDKQWKYGGDLQIRPLKTERWTIGASYANDLVENGYMRPGTFMQMGMWNNPYRVVTAGSFFQPFLNYVQQYMVWNYVELPGNVGIRLEGLQERAKPAFDYAFHGDTVFDFREASATVRWAPGEEYTRQGWLRYANKNDLPVLLARVSRGLEDGVGEYEWWRADASLEQHFRLAGRTGLHIRLNGGKIFQAVPLPRTYFFQGIFAPRNWFDVSYAFNTMRFQEFAAEEYAEAFIRYQPHLPWLGVGGFRPKLTLVANGAWGRWGSEGGAGHERLAIAAPERGYAEAGIFIQNLFPTPKKDNITFSFIRMFGIGAYRRIGPYEFANEKDNWVLKITFAPF